MVGDTRQGWALLAAMTHRARRVDRLVRLERTDAAIRRLPRWASIRQRATLQPGGNMEGKEVRFGIANSALWATATTAASNGSVNSMHDSLHAARRSRPAVADQLGEVIFGGVGSGLYGMLDLRHHRGLHRRTDGRTHAGIPRQEDRGVRDEDGGARHARRDRCSCLIGTAIAVVDDSRRRRRR